MNVLHKMDDRIVVFHCPGCQRAHWVRIAGPGPVWDWNLDMDKPTFSPSLVSNGDDPDSRCHSFVTNGVIEFLSDSVHALAGESRALPLWDIHQTAKQG